MRLLSVALLGVSAVAASLPVVPSLAAQQHVVAEIDLNVRRGQSTSSQILGRLDQGDTAEVLVPPKRSGYYHVRTAAGVTGWAWAARLTPVGAPVTPTPTPAPPAPPTPAPPSGAPSTGSSSIDPSWTKTPSNAADYTWPEGNHLVCQAAGQNGDDATNLMKNRTDEPASYHAVTWDALESLTFPRNQKSRRGGTNPWTASELAQLAQYEGTPISVEAYLSGIKEQIPENDSTGVRKKGEATNCGQNTSPRVDWHMYLTKGPNQSHRLSIVVETTPRVRPAHPNWNVAAIQQLSTQGSPVRISGWLMFDPEHWDQMWKYKGPGDTTGTKARITLWEIHPITKIEVKQNGHWVALDSVGTPPAI